MAAGVALLVGGVLVRLLVFAAGNAVASRSAAHGVDRAFTEFHLQETGRAPSWKAQGLPAWARVIGNLAYLATAAGLVVIIVSVFSGDDDDDTGGTRPVVEADADAWPRDATATLRRQFCGEVLNIDEQGEACDCVLGETQRLFPDATDFYDLSGPTEALDSAWRHCGVGRT